VDANWVNSPYLHHTTSVTVLSLSGTCFRPGHHAYTFGKSLADNLFGEETMRIEAPGRDLRQVAFCYQRVQTMALWSYGTVSL